MPKYYLSYPFMGNYGFLEALDDTKAVAVKDIAQADIVVFTGGADVNPALYGHQRTALVFDHQERDAAEASVYNEALRLKKPMFGICRGLQFLNVMNGGTLIQHLEGHRNGDHEVIDVESATQYDVNSMHHQAVVPPANAIILAFAKQRLSNYYIYGNSPKAYPAEENKKLEEIEAVYYPATGSLGVQWHPELSARPYDDKSGGALAKHYLMTYLRGYYGDS